MVVESARVDKAFLRPGESFTLSLTVRNQGTTTSPTTLRYYYSTDDTILTDDAPVGTDTVGSLPPDDTVEKSITLTAPDYVGTYYYGACVDPAANETATYNNCSAAVQLNVSTTPPFWVYWSDHGFILRATNDGTNRQVLVTGPGYISDLTLDVTGRKMYWTGQVGAEVSKIQRANLDGSNMEDLFTGSFAPAGIALDVTGGKMYWTNYLAGRIQRANLDGSDVEDLITGLSLPKGIALDITGGKMYWAVVGTSKIQRANLDGSNMEDIITTEFSTFYTAGIALDVTGGKMYWTGQVGAEVSKIQRANLDGSNMEDIIIRRRGGAIRDIALDVTGGKMYWADNGTQKIQRANLDGSNIEDLFTADSAAGIALGISPSTASPPTTPISFNPGTIADQTFTVGTPVSLFLPVATGGTPPYRYTLSPLPNGLVFDPSTRELWGVPTIVMNATSTTYIALDATGTLASLTFTIEVIGDEPDPLDVNGDGQVDVLDLVVVAFFYGKRGGRATCGCQCRWDRQRSRLRRGRCRC